MLTSQPRRAVTHRIVSALGVLAALGASLLGCPEAFRLDAAADGSTSGGDAGQNCNSNTDCAVPTPVCDTVKQQCFECLVAEDCKAKEGTLCSKGSCACPDGTQTFCPATDMLTARCVNTMASQDDCGSCGNACLMTCGGGVCAAGWSKIPLFGAPAARSQHVAVFDPTDKLMIVWGGASPAPLASGGIFDLNTHTWSPTTMSGAPTARSGAAAVWDDADKLMIVWGGVDAAKTALGTGAVFDPKANSWRPISTMGAPPARRLHTAVWDGNAMIVWGGEDGMNFLDTGARYDPKADTWAPIKTMLSARSQHTAVWSGTQMVVWGGIGSDGMMPPMKIPLNDGAAYDPVGDSWDVQPPMGMVPTARSKHTAVWTGTSMLIFGGVGGMGLVQDGGELKNTAWAPLDPMMQPEPRQGHSAVWIPATSEMIIWGGQGAMNAILDTGYRLNQTTLTWSKMPMGIPGRARHTAVAAGTQMLIWGGELSAGMFTNDGGIFDVTAK